MVLVQLKKISSRGKQTQGGLEEKMIKLVIKGRQYDDE